MQIGLQTYKIAAIQLANKMPIQHIHTFLVHPAKGVAKPPSIGGTKVPLKGKMYDMLLGVYDRSDRECDTDISFNHKADGTQKNDCRDLLVRYSKRPNLPAAKKIAARLASYTTRRSRLGLLFLMVGKEDTEYKLVVSRFPADSGILAEEKKRTLNVEFLERIFLKNASTYKAALYRHASLDSGFWSGKAADKQIGGEAHYWIQEFLASDFRTTSAAGTRRLALAVRDAIRRSDDVVTKSEIAAAVTLADGLAGQPVSVTAFADQYNLSRAARAAINKQIKEDRLRDEVFRFDADEFSKIISYRSIELDNGGILTAEYSEFDEVFHREKTEDGTKFSTEGRVVSEKLGKAKV